MWRTVHAQGAQNAIMLWGLSLATILASFAIASAIDGTYGTPSNTFEMVVPAASLCLLTSLALLGIAWRENNGELGIFALFFLAMSLMPLIHGLTISGVLYSANSTTEFTGVLALPIAVVAGAPLLAPRSYLALRVGRSWRTWVSTWATGLVALSVTLLAAPNLVPDVNRSSTGIIVIAMLSGAAIVWMSLMHLRLYRLSGNAGSFIASVGFVILAASALGWLPTAPNSAQFWLSHILDVLGVGTATIAGLIAYRQRHDVVEIMKPIVLLDPLKALEIGLDPTVHSFISQLNEKDEITRKHVVRVGELSAAIGLRAGLSPPRLSALTIAAVLHDIGKLEIDDEILKKPGRLTRSEYEAMKLHAALGADIVRSSPALAAAEPFVRAHHERPDGAGYPNGLSGEAVPLEARIIGVCDAFDAIANTRQYREGKGSSFALAVLREHAGSQFDEQIVELLAAEMAGGVPFRTFDDLAPTDQGQQRLQLKPICEDCANLLATTATS